MGLVALSLVVMAFLLLADGIKALRTARDLKGRKRRRRQPAAAGSKRQLAVSFWVFGFLACFDRGVIKLVNLSSGSVALWKARRSRCFIPPPP